MNLKPETLQKIPDIIAQYPSKRSATLPLLHLIQEELGYISDEAVEWVAEKLELQPINVFELLGFYPMFRREPTGKRHIKVCRTLSCALKGADKVCKRLQEKLNCPLGGTSEDGNFTIEYVECIASCGTAPVVQVDQTLHEDISAESVDAFAEEIRKSVSE